MRALWISPAAALALLAVTAAQAQRVSPSLSSPSVSSVGGLHTAQQKPSFYLNPKDYTLQKAKPWKGKNKKRCAPPYC